MPAADADVAQAVPAPTVVVHRQRPLLMPAADADVAQGGAVPASPRPFADSTAAAGSGPAVTTPTVVVHRQHRR